MIISIFAYSRKGTETAGRIRDFFLSGQMQAEKVTAYTMEKYAADGFLLYTADGKASEKTGRQSFYENRFRESDAMIFVGAMGIAVRHIAPFVRSKLSDPAVICIDELGKYVIPVLSGHIGGANRISAQLAEKMGSLAVITTATDINHRFSVDSWAVSQGLLIDNMKTAKAVSAAVLERDIPVISQLEIEGDVPAGIKMTSPKNQNPSVSTEDIGIFIGWNKADPFRNTLHLIPRNLYVGIGCRKGISKEAVEAAVSEVLMQHNIDIRAVAGAASIDIKSKEKGLLEYAESMGLSLEFYSADQLNRVKDVSSHSEFVKSVTGVDNVCERAALMKGSRLVVNKTAVNGVTVAVAEKTGEIKWEN